ncbi:membrane protein CcdC involved in cytochrome C biogenesis [Melghiribacillus thermohalophilus]|uniref:Membrane protein CcdC involved in cytochrome C biogenesis n=1 Tax=Melghiribacillus thermohalophilus TaxID=1324956 RepID=A0A4R3NH91_9BACI|nr:cytochrome c biogenesis protein CcdC [Melghiribacillus thermohalophilus]TCT26662.1 membrane protein CcdC involved in cytochrome C biogenesis [Melghiribacillus thermohalophilus]
MFWAITTTVMAMIMGTTMVFIRMKAAKKPASVKKIILPPLFMSTGLLMFLFPLFRITWMQVIEAFSVGVAFSVFLILTSSFEVKGKDIYLKPSKAFIFILFGLLLFRIVLKTIIGQSISVGTTSGMFFILAFGMIISWRIAMLIKFLRLKRDLESGKTIPEFVHQK